jgi:hypothetical protein
MDIDELPLGDDEKEVLRDIQDFLPDNDDLTHHVLFGHLLIERYMDKALSTLFNNPKPIAEARLTFAHKIALVEAFGESPSAPHWRVLKVFNKLRNELVHNLPREKMLAILRDFEAEFRHHFEDRPIFFDDEHIVLVIDQFVIIALGGLAALTERKNGARLN